MIALLLLHLTLIIFGGYFLSPEFTLYPYLTSQGFTPYLTLIDQHLPIIFFGPLSLPYWLIENRSILLSLFITILLFTDYLFYLSIKSKSNHPVFFTFALIVFSWFFGGNFFWLSTFITFFSSLTLYLSSFHKPQPILLGFFLGLIFLIKPTLFPALVLLALYLKIDKRTILGFLIPIAIITLYLAKLNLFQQFSALVLNFNSNYYLPLAKQLPNKRQLFLILLAFVPNLYLLFLKNKSALIVTTFFLILTYPRFEYLHLGPFILVLLYFTSTLKLSQNQSLALILTTTLFFSLSLIKLKNFRYGDFYFNQQVTQTSENIKALPGENILILGGSELIYPLSSKTPPRIYIPPLPWYFADLEYQQKILSALNETQTPILYYPSASVDGVPISQYTNFLNETLETRYNREEHVDYYLYLAK